MKVLTRVRSSAGFLVVANASSLVGTTAVTSALGYVYWAAAARWFAPADVGLAAAALSAALLLGTIGILGLGTYLIGELPRRPAQPGALISTSLLLAGGAGVVLGVAFCLAASALVADLRPLGASVVAVATIALGVGLIGATLVLDQALIGLLRGELQLGRNAIFAAAKLGALVLVGVWLANRNGLTIYATWIVGQLVSLTCLAGLLVARGIAWHDVRPRWSVLAGIGRPALSHHALNLGLQAPSLVLPLVVTVLLSAAMNAYFYVAWQVASLVTVGPMALSIALYAAGSREPAALPSRMRLTLGLALAIGLVANAVVLVGADRLLGLFGSAYAQQNALGLRILGLAVFPLIVKDHFVTLRRIQDRIAPATLIIAAGGLLEVSLAAVGAQVAGLPGVSAGYLAAACLEAVVMLPPVYRAATRREATETLAISAWGPHRAGDDPDGLVAVSRESR